MSDSILIMDSVSKAYSASAPILKGVSFKQEPGEFLAVVGCDHHDQRLFEARSRLLPQPSNCSVRREQLAIVAI